MRIKIETLAYHSLARQFRHLKGNPSGLKTSATILRHKQIQSQLRSIAQYLDETGYAFERLEAIQKRTSTINSIQSYSASNKKQFQKQESKWIFTYTLHPNMSSLLFKGNQSSTGSFSAAYHYGQINRDYGNDKTSLKLDASIGNIKAKGTCEAKLWKDKKFDPKVIVSANASAAVLSGSIQGRAGWKNIYAKAGAYGDIGALYANAKAVINTKEQTLEAGIGAAALKGEVRTSFHVFGANVTLTGQGSIGSIEGTVSYHHSAREWEFGSKMGFIAGLGFKVKVNY